VSWSLRRRNYFLGEDHLHRVSAQLYRFLSEQAGHPDLGRLGPDRIADADIDMKRFTCACQPRDHSDPYAAVPIFVTDCLSGHVVKVERKAVIQFS
jgi:hypothetical protein